MASRSSFWIMAPIRRSGISMGARRSTLPSIMRLVQQRPAVAAVPSVRAERKPDRALPQMMDAVQAVKVVEAVALLVVEGAAVVLLVVVLGVVPAAGTEAVRWPRVLKCRARRSSTCCWLPTLIQIRN